MLWSIMTRVLSLVRGLNPALRPISWPRECVSLKTSPPQGTSQKHRKGEKGQSAGFRGGGHGTHQGHVCKGLRREAGEIGWSVFVDHVGAEASGSTGHAEDIATHSRGEAGAQIQDLGVGGGGNVEAAIAAIDVI